MHLIYSLILAITPALLTVPLWAFEPQSHSLNMLARITSLQFLEDTTFLKTDDGKWYKVQLSRETLSVVPASPPPLMTVNDPEKLPDTDVASGDKNIRKVWFTKPTRRYDHGVLGDAIEAASLKAELSDGKTVEFILPPTSVFEDRTPRLADINGDGRDEIIAVRSYLDSGAAVTLIGERSGQLEIIAEAPSIGLPHRWLNPVGAADFDGDGKIEIAVVITPHIGGTLQLYEWRGNRLVPEHNARSFSNHAMGSRELGMSALIDINNDGLMDIVLPDAARAALLAVSFANGAFSIISRTALNGRLTSGLIATDLDKDGTPEILYVINNTQLILLKWPQ